MISVNNLDLGYQQCSELHRLLNITGGGLIKELENITSSLKVNWLGSDAKKHINNLINVHDALSVLVSEGILASSVAGEKIVAMQRVRSLNGGSGQVGDELSKSVPEIQSLSRVEDTSEYNVNPAVASDYQNLVQMHKEYSSFKEDFKSDQKELMSNWTEGANRESAEALFNKFIENSDTYEKYISSAEADLSVAVGNLNKIME